MLAITARHLSHGQTIKAYADNVWTFTVALALIGTPFITAGSIPRMRFSSSLSAEHACVFLPRLGRDIDRLLYDPPLENPFLGSPKSDAEHAKENGLVMTVPLCLLAIGWFQALSGPIRSFEADHRNRRSISHGEHLGSDLQHRRLGDRSCDSLVPIQGGERDRLESG